MESNNVTHQTRKLTPFGKKRQYSIMTIPKEFQKANKVDTNEPIHTYFSGHSKGYLLLVSDKLYKKKFSNRTLEIDFSGQKEIVDKVSKKKKREKQHFKDVLEDLVRVNIMSAIIQAYQSSIIKFKSDEMDLAWDIFKKFHRMENRLHNIESLQETRLFKIDLDEFNCKMTSKVPNSKDPEHYEYEYSKLTKIMLEHNESIFEKAVKYLTSDLDQNIYQEMVESEGALDFLWCYYLRQLKKGIDVGLFSGSELTGTHAICLSMFSKMLEQNADALMRLVTLLDYLKKRAIQDEAKEFLKHKLVELIQKIRMEMEIISKECKTLIKILPNTIDASPSNSQQIDEIYTIITENISTYHGDLVSRIGKISESYVSKSREESCLNLGKILFGEYEEFAREVDLEYQGKGYGFIISQINAELKRIAKFPRNMAIMCSIILTPIRAQKKTQS